MIPMQIPVLGRRCRAAPLLQAKWVALEKTTNERLAPQRIKAKGMRSDSEWCANAPNLSLSCLCQPHSGLASLEAVHPKPALPSVALFFAHAAKLLGSKAATINPSLLFLCSFCRLALAAAAGPPFGRQLQLVSADDAPDQSRKALINLVAARRVEHLYALAFPPN